MSDQKLEHANNGADAQSSLNVGLAAVHCPNCPDQGWYAEQDYATEEVFQMQCQFCYETSNSVFNIEAANEAANAIIQGPRSGPAGMEG